MSINVYIARDPDDNYFGVGATLDDAYENYKVNGGVQGPDEVTWNELGEEFTVDVKIIRKIETKIVKK